MMKAKQNPRKYTLEDVRRLIREYRPSYKLKTGEVRCQREHTSERAWHEIVRTRDHDTVAGLEEDLVRMANEPYVFARSKASPLMKPAARKRLARMPETLEKAAGDVEWTLSHPEIRWRLRTIFVKRGLEAAANVLAGSSNALRILAKQLRRIPPGKARLKDLLAQDAFMFLGGLEVSGKLNLKQAFMVLQPIYKAIGMSRSKHDSLKSIRKRRKHTQFFW